MIFISQNHGLHCYSIPYDTILFPPTKPSLIYMQQASCESTNELSPKAANNCIKATRTYPVCPLRGRVLLGYAG